ncbi:hypothetical protein EC973_000412 [Apophysomyces ossiformis]|uniref:Zn(2)-C6 fungal-type domain-containing protein n=1 Tax=Apophysomyces ossiformis TaxID=679940 RepID=A0A8H7BQT6_9FUNG|nr:hypothetical protein EC973_000412 [Apophysomyces ossiformis]
MLTPQAKDILNDVQKEEEAKKAANFFISYPGPEALNERKQSRVSKACRNCQLKKNKCDGLMPCGNCTRKKTTCEYQGKPAPPVIQQGPTSNPSQFVPSPPPQTKHQEVVNDDKKLKDNVEDLSKSSEGSLFRLPSVDDYGHFSGETAYRAQRYEAKLESAFPTIDFMTPPNIPYDKQLQLINVFYCHLNPFYLVVNKEEMIDQLHKIRQGQTTYLSPLFFYALFMRTAALVGDNDIEQSCMTYTYHLRNAYFDYPRVSTVLALVMLANHIEHRKSQEDLTRVWQISGEALRMVTDLGLHRLCYTEETDADVQLRIRTFWAAFIMDRTLSLAYGRPYALAEQDM